MKRFISVRLIAMAAFFCASTAMLSQAQTFTSLISFDVTDGAEPLFGSLIQGANGNLYGTTDFGGVTSQSACTFEGTFTGCGTVFEVTPTGVLTTIYTFCSKTNCSDGSYPQNGLVLGKNGNFFGTTAGGGTYNYGTIFELTPQGTVTVLHSLDPILANEGYSPNQLIQAANGNFYGTAENGGTYGGGTIFAVTPTGKYSTLYNFCAQTDCTDGQYPVAGLVQASNGRFYGTTESGGTTGNGTVFSITTAGKLTTIHSFCLQSNCTDGEEPAAPLIQGRSGLLYGTTLQGGAGNPPGDGTIFAITAAGKFATLHSFDYYDGEQPVGSLLQDASGNLYGTTQGGGDGNGVVYEWSANGKLTTLVDFLDDGTYPEAGLFQASGGTLYGTTYAGGSQNAGTVFSVTPAP